MICSANGIKPSMPPPIRQIPPSLLNEIVFIDFLLSLVMNLNYLVYHYLKYNFLSFPQTNYTAERACRKHRDGYI